MGGSKLQPLIYTEHIAVMFRKETVDKLVALAKQKEYGSTENSLHEPLKQPKRGLSRIVREIVENYLEKK